MSAGGVAMQSSSAGGIMVDGMRIGPPPDMPSLLLSNRIVYLGTPIASQVTELAISDIASR
jgi:ATP-dependent Clp protease protease subunit